MTFSSLFELFKGLFSRAFWFGAFLPLAIFSVANLLVVAVIFPGTIRREDWTKVGEPLTNLTMAFFAMVVLAYAVSPLIPLFKGILEGTMLPGPLHNLLRDQRAAEARKLRAERNSTRDRFNKFDLMISDQPDSRLNCLRKAYQEGQKSGALEDSKVAAAIEKSVGTFEKDLNKGSALDVDKVDEAAAELEKALRITRVKTGSLLDSAYRSFLSVLRDARQDANHRWLTSIARSRGLALENPQATQLGDARAIVESYSLEVYGVDFDYVWPRLQLVIPNDSPINERVVTAQGQVDFAALSLVLSLLFASIWLPVLAWQNRSILPLLIVGILMPIVVLFLYRLLFESLGAFGEVVKLAIDQYRLDLLTKVLRQPLPATLFAEREIWGRLCRAEQPGTGEDLIYRHSVGSASG